MRNETKKKCLLKRLVRMMKLKIRNEREKKERKRNFIIYRKKKTKQKWRKRAEMCEYKK